MGYYTEMRKGGAEIRKGFILERGIHGFGGCSLIFQLRCFGAVTQRGAEEAQRGTEVFCWSVGVMGLVLV